MSVEEAHCRRVAVTLPLKNTFTYSVPNRFASLARVGCRVLVPFRNRKVTGYILEKTNEERCEGLKEILDILDEAPLFHEGLVPFFEWMADYYLYPIGRIIQAALPSGINREPFKTGRLTEKGLQAVKYLSPDSEEKKALTWINENPGKRLPPSIQPRALQKKGWLTLESKTRGGQVGPIKRKIVRAKNLVTLHSLLRERDGSLKARNETQFLETVAGCKSIPLSELNARFSNGSYLVEKWTKRGALECHKESVSKRSSGPNIFHACEPTELTDQQKSVLTEIEERLEKGGFSTCLLHGVTGSGKTEIYYRAVEHVIREGGQAILLAPEIALAGYMESIFSSRLGDRVALYHSGLTQRQRYEQWIRMAKGEVDLVVGARSALFAPFPKLGLIIVDEEHDPAYKQEEAPRYHGRDAAVVRGKGEGVLVLLGSGSPSVQSFQNTVKGRYHLLSMPERFEKRPMPVIQIVDMKTDPEQKKNGILSPILREAIDKTLKEGKQVILFLNRRGFNRVYLCRSCGQAVRCCNCDTSLIYHLEANRLACHHCGFHCSCMKKCPSCACEGMRAYGFGTEKLEQELKGAYPDSQIARMDRDTTRRKGVASSILKKFSRHQLDILVGTQMITKGYDFPDVTLVGVIAADLSLGFPDFRAGERTFQILSQVAGRAGRGKSEGKVIVQTFHPEHYAITAAQHHDYQTFFHQEKELREQLGYPPFSYLACLRFQGNNREAVVSMANRMARCTQEIHAKFPKGGTEMQVLGPSEAPLAKLKGKYRWQILLKSKRTAFLHVFLNRLEESSTNLLKSTGVSMIVDVDPYQML